MHYLNALLYNIVNKLIKVINLIKLINALFQKWSKFFESWRVEPDYTLSTSYLSFDSTQILELRFLTQIESWRVENLVRTRWLNLTRLVYKYCIINTIIKTNKIIVRDINIFSNVEEFAKEFVKIVIILLIDFFLKYN